MRWCGVRIAECTDSVTISPQRSCAPAGTVFTCSATEGHPAPPDYSWTQLDSGETTPGQTFTVTGSELHDLQCTATYAHDSCPDNFEACHSTISVRSFGQ